MRKLIIVAIIAIVLSAFNGCTNKPTPCYNCGEEVDSRYAEICAVEGYTPLCEDCR